MQKCGQFVRPIREVARDVVEGRGVDTDAPHFHPGQDPDERHLHVEEQGLHARCLERSLERSGKRCHGTCAGRTGCKGTVITRGRPSEIELTVRFRSADRQGRFQMHVDEPIDAMSPVDRF